MAPTQAVLALLQPSEDTEQADVCAWAQLMASRHPELALLYAIPNGGRRAIRTARRLKATGVRPGVPDLHLPVARQGFHGLYLEMKRLYRSTTSADQKTWHDRLRAEGHRVEVCHGAAAAQAVLLDYLSG